MMSVTSHGARRRGLTLLELVVVLAILAALAGVLVPLLANTLFSAHTATGVTNIVEVEKLVQLYGSRPGALNGYPNQLDNLVDSTTDKPMTYVKTNSTAPTPDITSLTLTQPYVDALSAAGITTVAQLVEKPAPSGSWNATFFPYGSNWSAPPTYDTLATGTKVAQLTAAVAAKKFGVSGTGTYVVFGLGKYNSMAPKYIQETPVWFNPNANSDPDTTYSRFGLVFKVGDSSTTVSTASFIGAVEFAAFGAMTRDDNLSYNYSLK